VYDLLMASITKKVIRGRTYYYARECKRVDGKPKIVWQKYLGRLDSIITAVTDHHEPYPIPQPQREGIVTDLGGVVKSQTDYYTPRGICCRFVRPGIPPRSCVHH